MAAHYVGVAKAQDDIIDNDHTAISFYDSWYSKPPDQWPIFVIYILINML